MKNKLFIILIAALSFILYLLKINPETNDDIFVYFNYARNFSEGRFFAIDYRNIPSEGFSSILYMMMLVPFEFFKINPMLGGIILNYFAIFGISFYSYKTMSNIFFQKINQDLCLFLSLFIGLLIFHSDIIGVAGWAFETVYSGLILTFLFYLISRNDFSNRNINLILVSYLISHLYRPENLFIFSPVLLWLFLSMRSRRFILLSLFKLVIGISSIFLFKWIVFRDVFPTGYYRKFINYSNHIASGPQYVVDWLYSSPIISEINNFYIIIFNMLLLIYFGYKNFKLNENKKIFDLIILSFCVLILNIIFCLKTTPLIGNFNRYLISSNTAVILILFFSITTLLVNFIKFKIPVFGSLTILSLLIYFSVKEKGIYESLISLNVVKKLELQKQNHPYIKFGSFLRSQFPKHRELTISFGDGGAIPYSAQCNTIDPAGLTEPYIAKLAAYNGNDKVLKYSSYILSQNIDIFCMGFPLSDTLKKVQGCINGAHLPLDPEQIVEFYEILAKKKFVYVSSISGKHEGLPYDIHILINPNSRYFFNLSKIVKEYSKYHGYIRENDIIFACGIHRAIFPIASR